MKRYETFEDAKSLANEVLAGSLDPTAGCTLIASIGIKLNHPPAFEVFELLAHDQEGHEAFGIYAEDCIDEIIAACRHLIASEY